MEYLSASRLKLLSECKKQFYHRYILDDIEYTSSPFADFGTAMHKVLEVYRQHHTEMSRKQMVGVFCNEFKPEPEFKWLVGQGCKMIWKMNLNKVVLGELVAVEYPFDFELEGVRIRGIIDKIEMVDGKIVVTDYKTNKLVEPEKYFTQIAMYDLAMEQDFPDAEREYELYYLRHDKVVPFKFSEDFHKQTHETAHSVIQYVKENKGDPGAWSKMTEKDAMCKYCPLMESCWG